MTDTTITTIRNDDFAEVNGTSLQGYVEHYLRQAGRYLRGADLR